MKRYLGIAGAMLALAWAGACAGSVDEEGNANDGCRDGGQTVMADGNELCVFTSEIIETGFRCPPEFPHLYELSLGFVCSANDNLPIGAVEQLIRDALGMGAGGSGAGGTGGTGGGGTGGTGGGGTGGTGAGGACTTTASLAPVAGPVDVLLVVDNSGSMADEQHALATNFADFLAGLAGHDWQVGVTTTDIDANGEKGRLVPVDGVRPRIVGVGTANAAATIGSNVRVGTMGSAIEKGIGAALLALTPPLVDSADDPSTPLAGDGNLGFLRAHSHLAIVFLSDEEDSSAAVLADAHADLLATRGGDADLLAAHAIVPQTGCAPNPPASRYDALATLTGGATFDLCSPSWPALITALGTEVAQRIPDRTWGGLAAPPIDVDGDGDITDADVTVLVNGTAVSPAAWRWDASTGTLFFTAGNAPAPGDTVEIESACTP